MSFTRVEKVEINPINAPANNTYGFQSGFPIVQFEISNSPNLLVGTSVRLNGEFSIIQNGGAGDGKLVNNGSSRFGGLGGTPPAVFDACVNNKVGVAACIQQITLSNQDNNQSLEIVRQYPRYLASVMPTTHSPEDFDSGVSQQSGTASRNAVSASGLNQITSFSMPLRTGLLSGGEPLPLGLIGGLSVQLDLSPDSNAIGPVLDATGVETSTGSSYYRLQNLTLTYDLLVPDDSTESKLSNAVEGSISYNSISHIYSTINSSDQTLVLNLGGQRVLSVFSNFIPTPHINNSTKDSNGTPFLTNKGTGDYDPTTDTADITEVSFAKGGVNFPLENPIVDNDIETGFRPQVELLSNFINAIKPFRHMNHSLIGLQSQSGLATDINADGGDTKQETLPDHRPVAGFGVRTDPFKVGINYSRQPYGLRIRSTLDGVSPNSIFTYVLSENTLAYSPNGIRVIN